jgi:dihydrodipicolinate synthase/N-acetylneuraminate lyase
LALVAQQTKGKEFDVLVGRDDYLVPGFVVGCAGGIVGMSASMGFVHRKLMQHLRKGEITDAAALQHKLSEVASTV